MTARSSLESEEDRLFFFPRFFFFFCLELASSSNRKTQCRWKPTSTFKYIFFIVFYHLFFFSFKLNWLMKNVQPHADRHLTQRVNSQTAPFSSWTVQAFLSFGPGRKYIFFSLISGACATSETILSLFESILPSSSASLFFFLFSPCLTLSFLL